jgi:xylulokinase
MSVLGLDIGTSGCKALVIDERGDIKARAHREYNSIIPSPGWIELNADALWNAVQETINEVTKENSSAPVLAMCMSTMGDSFVSVDKHGAALGNFILASDGRSKEETLFLEREISAEKIFRITGMPPHPINTITKIIWLKNHVPEIFSRAAKFLCAEEFVISRLGLSPVTSYSNACRTMAFSLQELDWSKEILEVAGIGKNHLPDAQPSGEKVGIIPLSIGTRLGLGGGVKVISGGMDQACGTLGSYSICNGCVQDSMGTVEAISITLDRTILNEALLKKLFDGCYSINLHVVPERYLIMALVLNAGSILTWFKETIVHEDALRAAKGGVNVFDALLSNALPSPTHLLLLPYFTGSGTPDMNPLAKGLIMGLDLGTRKEDILKAILQGIAYEVALNVDWFEKNGMPIEELRCVGGGSSSRFWLQMKADLLGKPVKRMVEKEAAVLGAAILAGVGEGIWDSSVEASKCIVKEEKSYTANNEYRDFYRMQKALYQKLVARIQDLYPDYDSLIQRMKYGSNGI